MESSSLVESHKQNIFYLNTDALIKQLQVTIIGQYTQFRKNNTSFCKLFFCSLLKTDIEKILYIDCDTIIVDDLSGVLNIDMSEYSIGMVQDALISVKMKRQLQFVSDIIIQV